MPDIPDIERILFTYHPDGTLHGAAAWDRAGSVTGLTPDDITALAPRLDAAAHAGIEAYRTAAAEADAARLAAEAARDTALAAKTAAETDAATAREALATAQARIAELTAEPPTIILP